MNKLTIFLKIAVCTILLFSSCKKDGIQKEIFPDILSTTPAQFKSWFNNRFSTNQISIHGLSNTIDSSKSLNSVPKLVLEPVWAEAKNYTRGDSILAEIPLKNGNIAFSQNQIDAKAFDFSKAGNVTSLLFIQTDSKVRGVLMTIIGDEGYLQGDLKKLKNNTFRKKEKNFSGDVLYHTTTPMKKRNLQALMLKTLFVKRISRLLPTDNVMEDAYIGLKPSSFNTVM
jgi:hypothetical protein